MTVTIRLDDELRKKDYWSKVSDNQTFEYLRDRAGGIAMLRDKRGNLVSCVKDKVVFTDPVVALVESVITVPEVPIDNSENREDNSQEET